MPLKTDDDVPLSYHLGILGDTGMSAYFGLKDIAQPQQGDTVVISAAAGAVGYVAGQIARIMGATNPADADPGTIRADFATKLEENVVHGSDSEESAERELGLFFNN